MRKKVIFLCVSFLLLAVTRDENFIHFQKSVTPLFFFIGVSDFIG